jgi:hypothetical protein
LACFKTPAFIDKRSNITLSGFIYIGLCQDSILLLRIDFSEKISRDESLEIIGYVLHSFSAQVLKPNKYYTHFIHEFKFGGPSDENWYKSDIRDSRSIKLFSKSDKKTYFLAKSETANYNEKKIHYSAPNNISLSLNLMKKSLKKANLLYGKLIIKNSDKKIELGSDLRSELYDLFEEIQTSIIFSYISIEAFANAVIPEDHKHERFNEKGIQEIWNKENIERWMTTSEKVGLILPTIFKSSDIKAEPFWSSFKDLEKLRNFIVHQKTMENGTRLDSEIYAEMLHPTIFQKIQSSINVIDFFYKINNAHAYFPLGFGIARFQVIEIESMEKHFKEVTGDD